MCSEREYKSMNSRQEVSSTSVFKKTFSGLVVQCQMTTFYDLMTTLYNQITTLYETWKKGQSRRMYCAVVTVGSTVVAAGLFRVLGQDLAELPLAATAKANQRKGYLRLLISYLEKLLMLLNVRSFVLPATKNSKDMWKEKFGFEDMSSQQQKTYEENCWNMLEFPDTFMLHKVIAKNSKDGVEKSDRGRESI